MTTETSAPVTYPSTASRQEAGRFPCLTWSAILGGTVAAIGIHLLLTVLGVGVGLAIFSPMTDANPISNLSMGAGALWTLYVLVALWFGGLRAGRVSLRFKS